MSIGETIRNSQIWRSIFRHPAPTDRRNRAVVVLTNFFLHLHPVSAKKGGIELSYTWCMGGVTFFLFLVEALTGVLLMFYYRPTLEWAFTDIRALRDVTTLGIMREIHRWGAHAMVITVWLHMYRVFLTGSYKPPREFNWVIGVILLVLTLLLSFTGYLLPWDQLAIWAITVGSNMARAHPFLGHEGPGFQLLNVGGYDLITNASDARFLLLGARNVGEETLNRFYILHCVAVPIVISLLVATGFAIVTLALTKLIHPTKYNKVKLEPYECGIEPVTGARDRYSIRYYLVAMLFVIFDVETVFMYPWAVVFDRLLLFGLIEMLIFIGILVVGYYYAWHKGALDWI